MKKGGEKVWIVVERLPGGASNYSVYDNASDANNFCIEMQARRGDADAIKVEESLLNRREWADSQETNERPWGSLRVDVSSEFVEGLMEEMAGPVKVTPGAAERFVGERIVDFRARAADSIEGMLREELEEKLRQSMEEWCSCEDMEY